MNRQPRRVPASSGPQPLPASTRLAAILVLAALVLAGCTGAPSTQPVETPVDPGDVVPDQGNNTTLPKVVKPPVARMQIFGADNALVFESNFVADNATAPAPVEGGKPITFLASASEAVDKTATVSKWDWDFGDGGKTTGRGVNHTFKEEGGLFKVTLQVTDTNGATDVLAVTVGVLSTKTFNETISGSGTLQVGTLGFPAPDPSVNTANHPLELASTVQGFPVEVEGLTVTMTATEPTSDIDLFLLDAEGTEVARSASGTAGGPETLDVGPGLLQNGTYTLRVVLATGANAGYTLSGEVLYRVLNPQVEAMFGGHQH